MDITDILINSVENKIPISFSKYGDGEFFCANSYEGSNCDGDNYTEKKKNSLINSFKYLVNETNNSYFGLWFTQDIKNYWDGLVSKEVKWAKYHSLFIVDENIPKKIILYKKIKETSLKKIIVCNPLLVKAKDLLNIDFMINVNFNNWFDSDFDNIIEKFKEIINSNEQYIIITCAGMGSKVLICELVKLFPNNIYLDFGSGLDKICTKKTTRAGQLDYEELINLLKDIIPEDWDELKI